MHLAAAMLPVEATVGAGMPQAATQQAELQPEEARRKTH